LNASGVSAERFIERLEAHRSAEELEKIQRYFKSGKGEYGEGDEFIGVRNLPVGNLRPLALGTSSIKGAPSFAGWHHSWWVGIRSRRRAHMSSSELIRWSGLAAVAGGVSLAVAELVTLSFFGYDFSRTATTGTYALYSALIMIAGLLLPLGLVGLYARQSEAVGALGLVGFVVAFIGTVLVAGFFWTSAFIAPLLAVEAPELIAAARSLPGFFRSFIVFGLGWLLFGIATLRAGVYPRAAAVLLVVGAVLIVIPLPLTGVVLAAAVAWMGYVLFRVRGTPAEHPGRVR
jgi:hypothetical protein